MVVDQIDTDDGRMLRLCSVPATRCNRLPLRHLTRGEPEVALLELASPASALTDAVAGSTTRTKAAALRQTMVAWTMSLVVTFVFLLLLVQGGNSIARCNLFPAPRGGIFAERLHAGKTRSFRYKPPKLRHQARNVTSATKN